MIALNAYQTWRIAFVRHEADFPAYLAGAHGILNGTNPYAPTAVPPYNTLVNYRPFIYPLFIAWLWIPFALLPPLLASLLWYVLAVAIFFKVLQLLAKLLKLNDERQRLLFYGSLSILFVSVIQSDLMFGQLNLFVLLLLLLGVKYFEESPMKSALGFGAAIGAKLMPIVILPVLAIKKFRASLLVVLSIFVLTIVIPFLIAGAKIIGYYHYWLSDTIGGEFSHTKYGYSSFDVAGVLAQLAGMDQPTALLRIICGIVLLIFPLILINKGNQLIAFFLSFLLIPLTATRSEPEHVIFLMPAMGLFIVYLLRTKANPWKWFGVLALQLMVLWGYNKTIPFDTMGMLVLFGIVFTMGLRMPSGLKTP
ncbi:MAG TPA: glycosyltransferase family 87 protein [Candidatus Kapabacteria bacterium]|nr:glycosyltransferase family 87 protein [Candidatus Kapabacteria bacterium]